jgi:hypothetical protein
MPAGRPSLYSKELASKICEEIAQGKSLRTICKADEMPAVATIFLWFQKHKEFVEQYDKAKQEQAVAMAEEILDIADDGTNDYYENDDGKVLLAAENIQRSRLRVDTRKWLLSKLVPKKYGDRVTQDVNINNYTELPDDELARKLAEKRQEHEQSKVH